MQKRVRSCGFDMKLGETWFPRLLVIATRVPREVLNWLREHKIMIDQWQN